MSLSDSMTQVSYLLWLLLALGGAAVPLVLVVSAIRRPERRWWKLAATAVTVAATLATAMMWINPARSGNLNCTMDALSTALASPARTRSDHECLSNGRLRAGLSGGLELVVLVTGAWLVIGRPARGGRAKDGGERLGTQDAGAGAL